MKYYSRFKSRKAFTLIELLIVIGILAVLATTVLLVINPAQLVKQSRDANRITELNQINKALMLFQAFGGNSNAMGNSNIIYISLPDTDPQCGSYYGKLTATSTGWNYHCSTSASYRNVDGTGWIPVDLTSIQSQAGTLFSNLPIDPIQASDLSTAATNGYYYTYIHGSWALSATMESDKYLATSATSDGGSSSTRFETGNDLTLNTNLGVCPASVNYGGKTYLTALIGTQCWMTQNMNIGTRIAGVSNQTDNGMIEKYCYSDLDANCLTDGGLYQWNEAMQYSTTIGAQGICPNGWHIPTDTEWKTLVEYAAGTPGCEISTGWQCSPAGSHLSSYTLNGDNSTGFSGILAGWRGTNGLFNNRSSVVNMWASVASGNNALERDLYANSSSVVRVTNNDKNYGFSVRCLKN